MQSTDCSICIIYNIYIIYKQYQKLEQWRGWGEEDRRGDGNRQKKMGANKDVGQDNEFQSDYDVVHQQLSTFKQLTLLHQPDSPINRLQKAGCAQKFKQTSLVSLLKAK